MPTNALDEQYGRVTEIIADPEPVRLRKSEAEIQGRRHLTAEHVLETGPTKRPTIGTDGQPISTRRSGTAQVLQRWEGEVTEVEGSLFSARLWDLSDGEEEMAEFPLDEVSEDDKALLAPGAMFYWLIGYATERNGQKTRFSRIVLRRVPPLRDETVRRSVERAQRLHTSLDLPRR